MIAAVHREEFRIKNMLRLEALGKKPSGKQPSSGDFGVAEKEKGQFQECSKSVRHVFWAQEE